MELDLVEQTKGEKMTIKSYPSSWSLTSGSPLLPRRRSDSVSSGPHATNMLDKRDTKGRTPLFNAAKNGDIEEVEKLLKAGADPNITDDYGVTPLHESTERSYAEIAELLIANGECKL